MRCIATSTDTARPFDTERSALWQHTWRCVLTGTMGSALGHVFKHISIYYIYVYIYNIFQHIQTYSNIFQHIPTYSNMPTGPSYVITRTGKDDMKSRPPFLWHWQLRLDHAAKGDLLASMQTCNLQSVARLPAFHLAIPPKKKHVHHTTMQQISSRLRWR